MAGAVLSGIHALLAISLRVNQIVSGLALVIVGGGLLTGLLPLWFAVLAGLLPLWFAALTGRSGLGASLSAVRVVVWAARGPLGP
ncbi:MAG: hypothetical protein J4F50_08900 [Acidimicrobiia bacterium]|nr:hypothetical protein [Acidimicrobiia bacterium]